MWISERWVQFREFVARTADMPVGELMRTTCFHDPGDAVTAGYEAPFPTVASKAALRGLPMSVPRSDDEGAIAAADALCAAVRSDPRPVLTLWGEHDLILTLASGQRLASRIGRRIDHVIPEAGHALPGGPGTADRRSDRRVAREWRVEPRRAAIGDARRLRSSPAVT